MNIIATDLLSAALLHGGPKPSADMTRLLKCGISLQPVRLDQLDGAPMPPSQFVIADMAGLDANAFARFEAWRASAGKTNAPLILVVDDSSRHEVIRRGLNTGANLVRRPIDDERMASLMRQLSLKRFAPPRAEPPGARRAHYLQFPDQADAMRAGNLMLDEIFGSLATSEQLNAENIAGRSTALIDSLSRTGLPDWVVAVRAHHDMTYQHCLLVTGTLLAFGQHLNMRKSDLVRLALGGMLHDIGKADVPLEILDKPAALTPDELAIMRQHPLTGVERLEGMIGVNSDIITFTRDHHELIDGSGYPHGLANDEISDPVRLLTIADIFSALIERRSYKKEMKASDAIAVLASMETKVDQAILRSVLPVMRAVTP